MAQQYIGSKISLISKSDIRYRGILHSIDPAASTVSLEQVRSMGTEGRKSNPSEEIAPTDQLYEFIVFRAADVKDLSIEAPAEPKPEPPKPSVPDDPAIMSTTAPPRAAPNPFMPPNMMAAPPGMFNSTMPPMMYPPGNVPPQWPPYVLPPPGQMHPMMGFPPQPGPPLAAPAQQPSNQSAQSNPQSAPKSNLASASKAAPPHQMEPSGSPANLKASALSSGSANKPTASLGSNPVPTGSTQSSGLPSKPAAPSNQTRVPGSSNDVTATKSVFGSTTAMDMMATIVAMNPQPGSTSSNANMPASQNYSALSANVGKSSQSSGISQPGNKLGGQHLNNAHSTVQTLGNGHPNSTSQPSHQQMRHPLPQVPTKAKAGGPKSHGGAAPNSHKVNHNSHHQVANPIVPAQDFDFASANAKFSKPAPPNHQAKTEESSNDPGKDTPDGVSAGGLTASEKLTENPEDDFIIPEAPPGTYYDKKKSFFDDISSEVKERSAASQDPSKSSGNNGIASGRGGRGGGRGGRGKGWDRNAERQKNLDTFGEVALHPNLGALGSGYNGYGRGGIHRMGQAGGGMMNGYRGMGGRGRGGHGRGNGGVIRGSFGANPRGGAAGMIQSGIH